jgi:small-conductance mechanosensitive channel
MEFIARILGGIDEWFYRPLFEIGNVEVNLSRLAVVLLIVSAAWWLSSRLERAVRGLSSRGKRTRMSSSAAYALGRIVRYVGIVVGVLIGLHALGVELTSVAIFGGAVGVGVGIGLQSIFNNFLSGLVLLFEERKYGISSSWSPACSGVSPRSTCGTRVSTERPGRDHIVPNSEFTEKRVRNWSYGEQTRRITCAVLGSPTARTRCGAGGWHRGRKVSGRNGTERTAYARSLAGRFRRKQSETSSSWWVAPGLLPHLLAPARCTSGDPR